MDWTSSGSHEHGRPALTGYDAFLCYAHRDQKIAFEIGRSLSQFSRRTDSMLWLLSPPFFQRGLRVFRDSSELFPSDKLEAAITSALRRSRYLVLIASPHAAQSRWVAKELEIWRTLRPRESILVVLVDGTIESSVPAILREDFEERLWIDLRWTLGGSSYTDVPQFHTAMATLAAPIIGVSSDALLVGEAQRHRRIRRATAAAVLATAFMLLAALVAYYQAVRQLRTARAAQEQAAVAEMRARDFAAELADSQRQVAEAGKQLKVLEESVLTLSQELAKRDLGLKDPLQLASREQVRKLEAAVRTAETSAAEAAKRANDAELHIARVDAARVEAEYQLNVARADLRRLTESPTWIDRVTSFASTHATTLVTTGVGLLVLATFSTRIILLLLRLEFAPITAIAIPFYLTRFGRWRLYRRYAKDVVTPEVAYHARQYLDLPYEVMRHPDIVDPLQSVIRAQISTRDLVVVAGGGRGKSTLCHRILADILEHGIGHNGAHTIPVLIDGLAYDGDLLQNITDDLIQHDAYVNAAIVDAQLTAGHLLIIFDGWSEVRDFYNASDDKADVAVFVKRYPRTRIVFTSRSPLPATIEHALGDHAVVQLKDIDDETLRPFLRRYMTNATDEAVENLMGQLSQSPLPLPHTPLMLRLVAAVFDKSGAVPRERITLFDEYLQQLFRQSAVGKIDFAAIDFTLKYLTRTTYLASRGNRGFPVSKGVELLGKIKDTLDGFAVRSLPIQLLNLFVHAGLYRRSGDRMRCFHDSFESYFAAKVLYDEFGEGRHDVVAGFVSDVRFFETWDLLLEICRRSNEEVAIRDSISSAREKAGQQDAVAGHA